MVFGTPVKVSYLHDTSSVCLSVVLVAFGFSRNYLDGYFVGKELFECVVGKTVYVLNIFFPTWCLCWDFEFNCIDSWSIPGPSSHVLSSKESMSQKSC